MVARVASDSAKPLSPDPFPGREDPSDLIGLPAPRIGLDLWIGSEPLEVECLRGKVVLLRWWTDTCPFCVATAPALVELQEKYRGRGLVVIGIFHPKPPGDRSLERARSAARTLGFTFPVALDPDWKALRRWWLDRHESWTSVSFLLDRRGVIRYVHPGGEFHAGPGGAHWGDHESCRRERREIEKAIVRLLDEQAP